MSNAGPHAARNTFPHVLSLTSDIQRHFVPRYLPGSVQLLDKMFRAGTCMNMRPPFISSHKITIKFVHSSSRQ